MKSICLSLFACLGLTACAPHGGQDIVARLGDSPTLSGGSYTSGGGVTVATDIREKDGRTLICGAWAQSVQQSVLTKGKARQVVALGAVTVDRKVIARNLTFLREVPPAADYAGSEAGCRLTERPWSEGDAARRVEVRIPRHVVQNERDEPAGGIVVYFRPDGPGAGG